MRTAILGSLLAISFAGFSEVGLLHPAIAQSNPTQSNPVQSSSAISPIKVKLLSPGTGNRQTLRFKPVVGTKQLSLMSFDQALLIKLAGESLPSVALPLVTTSIEVVVTKVDANGDIHYQFRYPEVDVKAKPGVQPAIVEAMRSQLKSLQEIRGSFVMSDRGNIKAAQFDLPETLDPTIRQVLEQMSQSVNQLSFPFPEEPVAIGAKWQASNSPTLNGITLIQTSTYELVDLKNGVATLKFQVEQQASQQRITPPPPFPNLQMQLKSLTSQGEGQSILDLSKPFVQSATLSMKSASQMNVTNPEVSQEIDMAMQVTVQLNFEPK
ncbi:hypothetical protein OsccyDRAFT_2427 [Leptolyngbyaceae cyanobacterium JSC-12]|nr:hypothetical protein OsccyDRAFT_2427 [Leptolyngbyaceae cyanobacterium JSC-12]